MRKFKTSIALFALIAISACTKKEFKTYKVLDPVLKITEITPSIIGKWKLVEYDLHVINQYDCAYLGNNTYIAETHGNNILIELTEEGIVNYYDDDLLVSSWLVTEQECDSDQCDYRLNGSSAYLSFRRLSNELMIADCSIGDTITITNPFANVNTQTGQIKNYSIYQRFVKIE